MVEDKTTKEVMNEPWNYDRVCEAQRQAYERAKKGYAEVLSNLKKAKKLARKSRGLDPNITKKAVEEQKSFAETAQHRVEDSNQIWQRLRGARPFLIGQATLDSLLNSSPSRFDYILKEKLPFDNLFFDLVQPESVQVPFDTEEARLIGANFLKRDAGAFEVYQDLGFIDGLPLACYGANFYLDTQKGDNPIKTFGTSFGLYEQDDKFDFVMSGRFLFNEKRHSFVLRPSKDLAYVIEEDMNGDFDPIKERGMYDPDSFREMTFSDIEGGDTLVRISNLCVNMINYVNAHNVTIVKRDRSGIKHPDIDIDPVVIPVKDPKPFYLVTIKDGVLEDEGKEGKSWELKWRLYIRGHDRRFRDERGRIVSTSWVRPHIRGPPDAPWRHQRYEVLAEKLEQEREMYRQHGIEG